MYLLEQQQKHIIFINSFSTEVLFLLYFTEDQIYLHEGNEEITHKLYNILEDT